MMIHEVTALIGAHKKRKRVGRGIGSGHGKTATRGMKGAGARSGFGGSIHPAYEGGAMPYYRRIPKRGFNNANFTQRYVVVNVAALEKHFEAGAEVNGEALFQAGLLQDPSLPVKILGDGALSKKLTVKAAKFSGSARQKIEASGGTCTAAE